MSHHMTSHDGSHDKYGKVVHRLCSSCISSVENLMGTLSSSLCQSLNYHEWSLTICDGCFDTLKSSKMRS